MKTTLLITLLTALSLYAQTNIPVHIYPEHITPTGYVSVAVMPDGSRQNTSVQWPDYQRHNGKIIDCVRYESLYPDAMLIHYCNHGDIIYTVTNTACYKLDLEQRLQSVSTQRTVYVATYVDSISGKTNVVIHKKTRSELITPNIETYPIKPKQIIEPQAYNTLQRADTIRTQRMERAKSVRGYSISNDGKKEIIRYFDGHTKTNTIRKLRGYMPAPKSKDKKK